MNMWPWAWLCEFPWVSCVYKREKQRGRMVKLERLRNWKLWGIEGFHTTHSHLSPTNLKLFPSQYVCLWFWPWGLLWASLGIQSAFSVTSCWKQPPCHATPSKTPNLGELPEWALAQRSELPSETKNIAVHKNSHHRFLIDILGNA